MSDFEETRKDKSWITEAFIIAFAPVAAYTIKYSYELGFARQFGIPEGFIDIDLTQILSLTVVTVMVFLIIALAASAYKIIFGKSKHIIFKKMLRLSIVFILLFPLSILSLITGHVSIILACFLFFGTSVSVELVHPLLTQKQKVGYIAKLEASVSLWEYFKLSFSYYFGRWLSSVVFTAAGLTILLVYSFVVGHLVALRSSEFIIVKSSPDMVVLRQYGDKLICAPLDRTNKKVERTLTILKVGEDLSLKLRVEEVGPLSLRKD
ncbi:MAG: hypothetical protein MUP17_00990 [candidate division Zixibacteria bacterium]|nr:hypothetical protein [candidate division Zixibacteria bacterium]